MRHHILSQINAAHDAYMLVELSKQFSNKKVVALGRGHSVPVHVPGIRHLTVWQVIGASGHVPSSSVSVSSRAKNVGQWPASL